MTIQELLGHSTDQLAAMTDEQLRAALADCLIICPPNVSAKNLVNDRITEESSNESKPAKIRTKKKKQTPQEILAHYAKELGLNVTENF